MALSNKQKQAALRKRRVDQGQRGRLIYLSNDEFEQVKAFIEKIRTQQKREQ